MSASLVGSEMCIRDRCKQQRNKQGRGKVARKTPNGAAMRVTHIMEPTRSGPGIQAGASAGKHATA
eukprot:13080508-Alexandrium_andersonii.AAC.1